jgi:AcrR family transcriptional regulator
MNKGKRPEKYKMSARKTRIESFEERVRATLGQFHQQVHQRIEQLEKQRKSDVEFNLLLMLSMNGLTFALGEPSAMQYLLRSLVRIVLGRELVTHDELVAMMGDAKAYYDLKMKKDPTDEDKAKMAELDHGVSDFIGEGLLHLMEINHGRDKATDLFHQEQQRRKEAEEKAAIEAAKQQIEAEDKVREEAVAVQEQPSNEPVQEAQVIPFVTAKTECDCDECKEEETDNDSIDG